MQSKPDRAKIMILSEYCLIALLYRRPSIIAPYKFVCFMYIHVVLQNVFLVSPSYGTPLFATFQAPSQLSTHTHSHARTHTHVHAYTRIHTHTRPTNTQLHRSPAARRHPIHCNPTRPPLHSLQRVGLTTMHLLTATLLSGMPSQQSTGTRGPRSISA